MLMIRLSPLIASLSWTASRICQFLERIVDREIARLLDRWKLVKGASKSFGELPRCGQNIAVMREPIEVAIRGNVGQFERVGSQIEQLWRPQPDKGFLPDFNRFA